MRKAIAAATWLVLLASPARAGLDLDGDTDRDGRIRFTDVEEALEPTQSVIVMTNCDKDNQRIAGMPDNADTVVNGHADRQDMEPIVLRKPAAVPTGTITLDISLRSSPLPHDSTIPLAKRFRVFLADGHEIIGPTTTTSYALSLTEKATLAQRPLMFFVEGLEFRTSVQISVRVNGVIHDSLLLETAPFILTPHSQRASTAHVVQLTNPWDKFDSRRYVRDFRIHTKEANVRIAKMRDDLDVFVQDEMCWGYTQTPRHLMPVVLHMHRQYGPGLDSSIADNVRKLLAPGLGYFKAFEYPLEGNLLNYGGNVEVTPPTTAYSFGRIYYGSIPSSDTPWFKYARRQIAPGFQEFFKRQGVQKPIDLTSDWLLVGHVDEIVSFLPKRDGGLILLIASPQLGLRTLHTMGWSTELDHRYTRDYGVSNVGELLALRYLTSVSFSAFNRHVDRKLFGSTMHSSPGPGSVKHILMNELGLTEADVVEVPALFENSFLGERKSILAATALAPAITNAASFGDHFVAPDPFIPAFRTLVKEALSESCHVPLWIDNWDLYHLWFGEVHCGSIVRRTPFDADWWTVFP